MTKLKINEHSIQEKYLQFMNLFYSIVSTMPPHPLIIYSNASADLAVSWIVRVDVSCIAGVWWGEKRGS
jgi:hypothetical protein